LFAFQSNKKGFGAALINKLQFLQILKFYLFREEEFTVFVELCVNGMISFVFPSNTRGPRPALWPFLAYISDFQPLYYYFQMRLTKHKVPKFLKTHGNTIGTFAGVLAGIALGVNFINIKCTNFSYARWFRQLFSSYIYIAETTFVRKIRTFNVDEIDGRFHT